jgi:glycosyltransferase involved in cell wall biosynthesis
VRVTAPSHPRHDAGHRPLRVLMATPRFLPETGGVETHVYETSRRLAAAGVEVTVLSTDAGGGLARRETIEGVQIVRVRAHPRHSDYRLAPGLGSVVRGGRWDLVHVQSYHTLVAPHVMMAALRARIPYVLSFHAGGHSARIRAAARPLQQRVLGPLIRRAARVVVLADFEVDLYGRRLRLPPERFVSVPNGADLPSIPAAERGPTEPGLIASVGRLERYKGHHRAIEALPHVLRTRPDARLWIAGAGPYEEQLRRTAVRAGVADRVEIRAVPPEDRGAMANEVSRAALVVLLSEFETHPIAALEAIALGRRVVVADTSGLAELARRGLARGIPHGSSPEAIAGAMLEEMARPPLDAAPDVPSWDDCARRLEGVYRDVLHAAA